MKTRITTITDWRIKNEAELPDLSPGEEFERVITPQKHVVLCRILVPNNLHLWNLRIGAVELPFQLLSADGPLRTYRPVVPRGAAGHAADEIAVVAGLDVRVLLRNFGTQAAKPHAALLVREEFDE